MNPAREARLRQQLAVARGEADGGRRSLRQATHGSPRSSSKQLAAAAATQPDAFLPPIDANRLGTPRASAQPAGRSPRSLRVDVTGKGLPLTTMLVDKLGQRGRGGSHQLRKAFKLIDKDGDGKVTIEEVHQLLSSVNIRISTQSLQRQFNKWSGGKEYLDWNAFIREILPEDFPTRYTPRKGGVHDVASLARHDHKHPVQKRNGLISNIRDWEVAFRDKLTAKTRGGPLELRKYWKMFDADRNGVVTCEEIFAKCASWNLFPSESVKAQLAQKYCRPENRESGQVYFYDFVKAVCEIDFKSSADGLRQLREKLEVNWGNLRTAFRSFDTDKSGEIDLQERTIADPFLDLVTTDALSLSKKDFAGFSDRGARPLPDCHGRDNCGGHLQYVPRTPNLSLASPPFAVGRVA